VRPIPTILLCALALASPVRAATAAPTAAGLSGEIRALLSTTAAQWAGQMTPNGVFENPFPADLALGHGSFAPPMLTYAVHRAGHVAAAERAWPRSVDPIRASAFDMVGAAYALHDLRLTAARRRQVTGYVGRYGIPPNGHRCLMRPRCYSNLKLVDALAVLAITGAGVRSPDPAARLADPRAARRAAALIVNRRVPHVIDHQLRARIGRRKIRGSVLSDPPEDPLAYHALSAFMLSEAVAQLGPRAGRAARKASREATEALSALVAPDGDASYLGRGQDQVWVPALAAAALVNGAAARPARAARYLAGARRAVRRLARRHASPRGLAVVGGPRTSMDGIDAYAHTVAYNGLALFGLTQALDALATIPAARIGRLPADRRLALSDPDATGLAVVSNGRKWLAVHRTATNTLDLRHDIGALALKRRTRRGWVDMLAPRPMTYFHAGSGGPALIHRGTPITPTGFEIRARGRTISVRAGYRAHGRWVRRVEMRWRLTRRGARMELSGAKRGDRFRVLAFTPASTGYSARRKLVAARARWGFDRPIRTARLRGYHSAPVEQLDALEARLTAPKSGRFSIGIGIEVGSKTSGASGTPAFRSPGR